MNTWIRILTSAALTRVISLDNDQPFSFPLCNKRYSANFAFHHGADPPNSGYHMNLQQARFPLSNAFAQRLEARYTDEDSTKV